MESVDTDLREYFSEKLVKKVKIKVDFLYRYETSDGISRAEIGELKKIDDNEAIVVRGTYSYTGADGSVYTVNYVADENGFQPEGSHLPQVA